MNVSQLTRRAGFVFAAAIMALMQSATGLAQSPAGSPATAHTIALSEATLSLVDETHVVITAVAGGDIKGSITFHLEAGSDNTWSGNWVLISSYVRNLDTDAAGTTRPHTESALERASHEEGASHESMQFVRDGGLIGSLQMIALGRASNGVITSVSGPLQLLSGTIKYDGASGDGSIELTNLEDTAASTGRVVLYF